MLWPHTKLHTVRRHIVMLSDGFCFKICLAVLAGGHCTETPEVGHWTAPPRQLRDRATGTTEGATSTTGAH